MLFAEHVNAGRLPASIQKLYTTSTTLLRFGPSARLTTSVLGRGWLDRHGVWHGTLYLRGGGDPTFGWAGFDRSYYGRLGGTVQALVANLISQSGLTGLKGSIVGDESYFDSLRGTAASGYRPHVYMTGELSALAFDRGFAKGSRTAYQPNPPLHAARQFAVALGARFGAGGTTAGGVAVVHSELSRRFDIHPRFDDGSGLSFQDSTTPRQVVRLLKDMAPNQVFVHSLAVGGKTGTLADYMRGTAAQGDCVGKTGTLYDVANLAGYCLARNGQTLVFAFLVNGISNPNYVHAVEANRMAVALAKYNG